MRESVARATSVILDRQNPPVSRKRTSIPIVKREGDPERGSGKRGISDAVTWKWQIALLSYVTSRPYSFAPRLRFAAFRAALTVLAISMATVTGPTPPGTGVIADAFSLTVSKSTSPTSR